MSGRRVKESKSRGEVLMAFIHPDPEYLKIYVRQQYINRKLTTHGMTTV
jgi:hypothetical protein